jgi:hypothetical protein
MTLLKILGLTIKINFHITTKLMSNTITVTNTMKGRFSVGKIVVVGPLMK